MRELADLQIGKTVLKFEAIEGVVVNEKKWSETHVRSSGPSVYSRNTTRHEVWIKQHGSGEETQLDLSDCGVETREGQESVAVAVNADGQRQFVLFVNRTARLVFPLAKDSQKVVAPLLEQPRGFFKMAIFFAVIAWMVGNLGQAAYTFAYDGYQAAQKAQIAKRGAETFNIPLEEYSQLSSAQRLAAQKSFVLKHQAKLLGVNELQRLGRAEWAVLHKLTQEKFGVPASYFYTRYQQGAKRLLPEQEEGLHLYLYGYPRSFHTITPTLGLTSFPHSTDVGLWFGLGVFLVGITRNLSRISKYRRNLNNATVMLASHINGLGNQLLGDGDQKESSPIP